MFESPKRHHYNFRSGPLIRPLRNALLIAAASFVAAGSGQAKTSDPGCGAAEAAAASFFAKASQTYTIDNALVALPKDFTVDRILQGWEGHAPGRSLVDIALSAPPSSALACPNVVRKLQDLRQTVDLSSPQHNPYATTGVRIAAAALGRDGRSALVLIEETKESIGGSEQLLLLELRRGAWRVTGAKLLSIS